MTVSVPEQLIFAYNGDGATTVFSYPVRFLDQDEILVVSRIAGVDTVKALDTDYTVTGAGDANGGSITTLYVPAVGETVILRRATEAKQIVNLADGQRTPAEAVEQQFDRLAMVEQDHDQRLVDVEAKTTEIDQAVQDAKDSAAAAATSEESASTSAASAASSATSASDSAAAAAASAASIDPAGLVHKADTDASAFGFVAGKDDAPGDKSKVVPTVERVDAETVYKVADRTALKALDTTRHATAYLMEASREGVFKWNSGDLSANVSADTEENTYIAPSIDATGASGAWVAEPGYYAPLQMPAYRRPLWAKLGDVFSAKDAGLKGDGVDDTSAMADLMAYIGDNLCTIRFPKGEYRITEALSTTAAAGGSVVLEGDGRDNSLIFLDYETDSGLTFNLTGNWWVDATPGRTGLRLANLGIVVKRTTEAGTGILIEGQSVVGRPSAAVEIENVTMRSKTGGVSWSQFIDIHNAGYAWITNPYLVLGGPSQSTANGIRQYCDAGMDSGSLNIIQPHIYYGNAAIQSGNYTEGVYITQPEIVGSGYGYQSVVTGAESGVHIIGGHINAVHRCVELTNMFDFVVANILLFRNGTTDDNWAGVAVVNGSSGSIVGNNIRGRATGTNESGILTSNTNSGTARSITIDGNRFADLVRGIWINSTSNNVHIGADNSYTPTVATRVLNQAAATPTQGCYVLAKQWATSAAITLVGGAATETYNLALPTGMFRAAPANVVVNDSAGVLYGSYDWTNSTATNAKIIFRNISGGTIAAGAKRVGFTVGEQVGSGVV